jgi:hypothetical protein
MVCTSVSFSAFFVEELWQSCGTIFYTSKKNWTHLGEHAEYQVQQDKPAGLGFPTVQPVRRLPQPHVASLLSFGDVTITG